MNDSPAVALVLLLLFGSAALAAGWWAGADVERHKATLAGVGRWEVDPASGKTRFVYGKECEK